MARTEKYSKEQLLLSSVSYVREKGIEGMTVRDLASFIGCSTQPIFRYYKSIEDFKLDLKEYLYNDYKEFISKIVDEKHHMLTMSYAYALYAKKEGNIFKALFISPLVGSRTVDEVLSTKRNIPTIESMVDEYNITIDKAREVYRDVRFYTHGIGAQLCCGSIKLTEKELLELIEINIKKNLK